MALIIVESPTKARTFNRILKSKDWGKDYFVFATVGHFRDLPSKEMAIKFENNFQPEYQLMTKKEKMVDKLKDIAKDHKEIYLATDLDREGESISYHVAYILGFVTEKWPDFKLEKNENLKRIIFHEITPKALEEALQNPSELRVDLVKAQQARRILDRIVGYKLSPLLWKKMGKHWLSAGRVQTVALRLVVEREKEIEKFNIETYFQLFGIFDYEGGLRTKLISKNGEIYEIKTKIDLFDGEYEYSKTTIDKNTAENITKDLKSDTFKIKSIAEEVKTKYPPPPFTTSLLQQEAFQKFRYPSKFTMRLAQSLYEKGLITYHRTDSFNLSARYVFPAKEYIEEKYGTEYALEKPRGFKTRSKNAQEAHEAIRPTKANRDLKNVKRKLSAQEKKLYELIFNRALATQMKEAEVKEMAVSIHSQKGYEFEVIFQQVLFEGFMKVLNPDYVKKNQLLPNLTEGTELKLNDVDSEEKQTRPPYRYHEGSLIKTLEQKGIGRPSTYASIISLIIDKHYVEKEFRYLKPTPLGTSITDYLSEAFSHLFDLTFTAEMEDSLDDVANGDKELVEVLSSFYTPFEEELTLRQKDKEKIEVEEDIIDEKCAKCSGDLVARYGKYGKFYACSNYPKCKYIKPNLRYVKGYSCPECEGGLVVRYSKKGKRFYGCENFPKCKHVQWALNVDSTKEKDKGKSSELKKEVAKKPAKKSTKKVVKKKTIKKKAAKKEN